MEQDRAALARVKQFLNRVERADLIGMQAVCCLSTRDVGIQCAGGDSFAVRDQQAAFAERCDGGLGGLRARGELFCRERFGEREHRIDHAALVVVELEFTDARGEALGGLQQHGFAGAGFVADACGDDAFEHLALRREVVVRHPAREVEHGRRD